jgi:hypothetical protein
MSKGRKGAIILSIAVFIVAILVCWVASKFGLTGASAELDRQLTAAKQDGLPVSADELRGGQVRDDDNAAALVLNQAQAIKDIPGDPCGVLLAWGSTYSNKPVTNDEAARAINQLQPVLQATIEASRRPHLDFQFQWEKGSRLNMPGLALVKQLVKILVAESRLHRLQGHSELSLEPLLAASRLSHLLSETPCVIAMLVEIACEAIVQREASDVARADSDPKILKGIREVLKGFGPMPDFKKSLKGDFVMFLVEAPRMGYMSDAHVSAMDDTVYPTEWKLMRLKPVQALNESVAVRDFRKVFECAPCETVPYAVSVQKMNERYRLMDSESPLSSMASSVYNHIGAQAVAAWTSCLARRRVLNAGLDILEHRNRSKAFPFVWSQPGPNGLDPFTDKPLAYHRTDASFVVYSFDKDLQDDGGRPYVADDGQNRQDISFEYPKLSVRPLTPSKKTKGPSGGMSGD